MKPVIASALLLAAMLAEETPPKAAEAARSCLDVALVLTLDASASVSQEEFTLQRNGIAAAFRNAEVLQAIAAAGSVAVSAVIWGSEGLPKQRLAWREIRDAADAETFARVIEGTPRQVTGDTGLGAGLATALGQFSSLPHCANRKVINVSGDGADTPFVRRPRKSPAPSQVKQLAEADNVEINALAISNEEPDLATYYASNVITGPDAFVMEVRSYQDIAEALRRKLVREIQPQQVSRGVPVIEEIAERL